MPSPFPGMNPYLENSQLWSQVHTHLIVAIAEAMNPLLRPKYRMAMEQRVYTDTVSSDNSSVLVGIPDNAVFQPSSTKIPSQSSNIAVAPPLVKPLPITLPQPEIIREWYLQVKDVETKEVITVIEILSPKNKQKGEGRKKYLKKREKILMSLTHLIEIDLLTIGEILPMNIKQEMKTDYRIIISLSNYRPQADLYAFNLPQQIPTIPLPLKPEDQELMIPLQKLLNDLYERGSYDLAINYKKKPLPELSEENQIWLDDLLKQQGLR